MSRRKLNAGHSILHFERHYRHPTIQTHTPITNPAPISIEDIVIKNNPPFSFDQPDVQAEMIALFKRRSHLRDNLNYQLIKGAVLGYHQVEMPLIEGRQIVARVIGVPLELLMELDTQDIPALYYGIHVMKGRPISKEQSLHAFSGMHIGELVKNLVAVPYNLDGRGAWNAIRAMKIEGIGFSNYKDGKSTIEKRMSALDLEVQARFYKAFFSPRFPDEENRLYQSDSNAAREWYVKEFTHLIKQKTFAGSNFRDDGFRWWFVPSESNKGKIYFVQSYLGISLETGEAMEIYNCSCPYGYRKMYGGLGANAPLECKHITAIKSEHKAINQN